MPVQRVAQHAGGQIEGTLSELPAGGQETHLDPAETETGLDERQRDREELLKPVDHDVPAGHDGQQAAPFLPQVTGLGHETLDVGADERSSRRRRHGRVSPLVIRSMDSIVLAG